MEHRACSDNYPYDVTSRPHHPMIMIYWFYHYTTKTVWNKWYFPGQHGDMNNEFDFDMVTAGHGKRYGTSILQSQSPICCELYTTLSDDYDLMILSPHHLDLDYMEHWTNSHIHSPAVNSTPQCSLIMIYWVDCHTMGTVGNHPPLLGRNRDLLALANYIEHRARSNNQPFAVISPSHERESWSRASPTWLTKINPYPRVFIPTNCH